MMSKYGIFQMMMIQNMEILSSEFTLQTLDGSLALVGGYSALIWSILSILLSWYQEFSYSNELALALYTRDKSQPKRGFNEKETA